MGTRQEFTFIGVIFPGPSDTQIFTWASLQATPGPDEGGTIPTTFAKVPDVEITRYFGDARFFIETGAITTTQVTIKNSGFSDPLPQTFTLKVVSRDTTAPAAGAPGVAVTWPYYATLRDVKDKLVSIDKLFGTNGKLTDTVLLNQISLAYGDIHAAAAIGGYNVPLTNTQVSTLSAGPSASAVPIALGITDITKIATGDLAFIHGASGTAFLAEFVGVVNIDTTAKTAVVMFLRNAYDSGVTIEKCTEAFKIFRQCNAIAAAMGALNSTTVGQSIGINQKVATFVGFLEKCLKGLMEGTLAIDGLTKKSGAIKTFQSENPDAIDVKNGPEFYLDMLA